MIPWPEPPSDLSTEVTKLKALKPDVIAPITRPASAQLLLPEIRKQRVAYFVDDGVTPVTPETAAAEIPFFFGTVEIQSGE